MIGELSAGVLALPREQSHMSFWLSLSEMSAPPHPLASLATSPQRGEVELRHGRAPRSPLPVGERSAPKAPGEGGRPQGNRASNPCIHRRGDAFVVRLCDLDHAEAKARAPAAVALGEVEHVQERLDRRWLRVAIVHVAPE